MHPILNYLAWPVVLGLLVATLTFNFFPEWLDSRFYTSQVTSNEKKNQKKDEKASKPFSYSLAVKKASPSVVNIYTQKKLPSGNRLYSDPLFKKFYSQKNSSRQARMKSSLGSGVVMTANGYILTNHHVVDGADAIVLQLQDGREAAAKVIGTDPEIDLAVLKINLENLVPIELANQKVSVGDVVLAIGNPFGVGQSVSQGIISATQRKGLGLNTFENFIQTDAAINPGNSGGPLVDSTGHLVGINSAILDRTSYAMGISFAIPSKTALKVLTDIITHGRAIRGWLGVEASQLKPFAAKKLGLNPPLGLVITNIYPGSPAYTSGLLPGDVIFKINNNGVVDNDKAMNIIASLSPGDSIKLYVLRNGDKKVIDAVAGTRPKLN
jgi:serine protease DegS